MASQERRVSSKIRPRVFRNLRTRYTGMVFSSAGSIESQRTECVAGGRRFPSDRSANRKTYEETPDVLPLAGRKWRAANGHWVTSQINDKAHTVGATVDPHAGNGIPRASEDQRRHVLHHPFARVQTTNLFQLPRNNGGEFTHPYIREKGTYSATVIRMRRILPASCRETHAGRGGTARGQGRTGQRGRTPHARGYSCAVPPCPEGTHIEYIAKILRRDIRSNEMRNDMQAVGDCASGCRLLRGEGRLSQDNEDWGRTWTSKTRRLKLHEFRPSRHVIHREQDSREVVGALSRAFRQIHVVDQAAPRPSPSPARAGPRRRRSTPPSPPRPGTMLKNRIKIGAGSSTKFRTGAGYDVGGNEDGGDVADDVPGFFAYTATVVADEGVKPARGPGRSSGHLDERDHLRESLGGGVSDLPDRVAGEYLEQGDKLVAYGGEMPGDGWQCAYSVLQVHIRWHEELVRERDKLHQTYPSGRIRRPWLDDEYTVPGASDSGGIQYGYHGGRQLAEAGRDGSRRHKGLTARNAASGFPTTSHSTRRTPKNPVRKQLLRVMPRRTPRPGIHAVNRPVCRESDTPGASRRIAGHAESSASGRHASARPHRHRYPAACHEQALPSAWRLTRDTAGPRVATGVPVVVMARIRASRHRLAPGMRPIEGTSSRALLRRRICHIRVLPPISGSNGIHREESEAP